MKIFFVITDVIVNLLLIYIYMYYLVKFKVIYLIFFSWKCKVKFKIINGRIFDPTQKLNNKKQDLFVKDGQ